MKTLIADSPAADRAIRAAEQRRQRSGADARRVAKRMIDAVRRDGDLAVSRVLEEFDHVTIAPGEIRVAPQPVEIAPELAAAIDLAIERITSFHERQKPVSFTWDDGGTSVTHRITPLRRAGIYAPGGRAVYVSTLIMCAVPARIAGVEQLVVATTPSAAARPEFQYACTRLGVCEIYRCGGAAGIAAMALGTESLERVDKIAGPGNAYVSAAKQLLVGEVGIDMTAGPTELVLIADGTARAEWIAADLLAQAEHGEDSFVVCVTESKTLAVAVTGEVTRQLTFAEPGSAAPKCIAKNALILLTSDVAQSIALANRIAPEHLSLHVADAEPYVAQLVNCGAIFTNETSPVAAGDYILGPNHVLPTAGTARFTSPLGVYDFVKRSNVVGTSAEAMAALANAGERIATFEGLPYHARSLALRGINR
jgi:histidinol dehydrogenase